MSDIDKSIEELSPKKRELFELLLKESKSKKSASQSEHISRRPDQTVYPLSFAQQRLWFIDLIEPGTPAYNMPFSWRFTGRLDLPALERALSEIERRQEILRARFPSVGGRPVQVISEHGPRRIPVINLKTLPREERETEARRLAAEEARRSFDLARGPLLRATLLRLDDEDHVMMFTLHHIISDGWSLAIFLKEVAVLYEAFSAGLPSPLPELPIQYSDFAHWQRESLRGEALETELSYWRQRLAGAPSTINLPADRPRPAAPSFRGATREFVLPADLYESLKSLSLREGVTLFMTTLAAFQTLLHRYTGQDDIVVGSPVANRNRAESDGLIGMLVNTLVLRADLSGNPTFSQLLKSVREVALGAYAHQDLPFDRLVEELQPERRLNQTPLFQVMFHLQNTPMPSLEIAGLKRGHFSPPASETAMFDLSLSLLERPDPVKGGPKQLTGSLEYNRDIFDASGIERMLSNFQVLLLSVAANPDFRLSELQLLAGAELNRLLFEWNDVPACNPRNDCYHHLFEARAGRDPDAIAVKIEGDQLTYKELNEKANHLAHYLRTLGVGPEAVVAICLDRSLEMAIAILGVLKAGGAYLPLDPAYPKEHLSGILESARPGHLLTGSRFVARLSPFGGRVTAIDSDSHMIEQTSAENPQNGVACQNAAYVIYTSGSTGKPKGVVVTHRNLVNHSLAIQARYGLKPDDRVLQFASFSFDVAAEELFPSWLSGAAVIMRGGGAALSGDHLLQLIEKERVTIVNFPSTYWHQLVAEQARFGKRLFDSVRLIIVGSEKVSAERFATWQSMKENRADLLCAYGVTEATITTTLYAPGGNARDLQRRASLPIGRPVAGSRLYLLDRGLRPVPIGAAGELYIGGDGLARGYWNRPGLTAEKFLPDPFGSQPGGRLYRTGDLARYMADGTLEFIERFDDQVKVRGFRIELGEVEAALLLHPGVQGGVITSREDASGQSSLIGYVVAAAGEALTANDLRAFLREKLPDYMVPSVFVMLGSIPLMPNGKVDRKALPDPAGRFADLGSNYIAPQSEAEKKISAIWKETLGVEKVGVHDNFFDLGGHSILMAEIFSKLQAAFKKEILMAELFEYPTVNSLARFLEQGSNRSSLKKGEEQAEKLKEGRSRLKQHFRQRQQVNKKK
ncbi:MAG TPA: amino acid adenylation domain-containing protein [Blastocatellia bacterium]|nr:amino acid adenylation domain-containing protein [Blastocatellia bacterium]